MKEKARLPGLLRSLREKLGLSQEQFAQRLGVTWSTVNRWENGKGKPSPLAREKLRAALTDAGLQGRVSEI
jgi:DNA-binding transcriptional regulator YiaG